MTLEQRVEVLEKQMNLLGKGNFVIQNGEVFFSDAFIKSDDVNAAQIQAAESKVVFSGSYEMERDRLLDNAATLTRDLLQLSRL